MSTDTNNSTKPKSTYNCFTDDSYNYYSCFYDTKEMREAYPENYPTDWSKNVILTPGRIICTPEIGLFSVAIVKLSKNLSWDESKKVIRQAVEDNNVVIATPQNRKPNVFFTPSHI